MLTSPIPRWSWPKVALSCVTTCYRCLCARQRANQPGCALFMVGPPTQADGSTGACHLVARLATVKTTGFKHDSFCWSIGLAQLLTKSYNVSARSKHNILAIQWPSTKTNWLRARISKWSAHVEKLVAIPHLPSECLNLASEFFR